MARIWLVLPLTGCAGVFGFGGQDFEYEESQTLSGEGLYDGDSSEPMDTATSGTAVIAAECVDAAESALVATASAGTIDVEHTGVLASCCASWSVETTVGDGTIDVVYVESVDDCDCDCSWTMTYAIAGLSSGEWTVHANGDEATVTVP